MTHTTAQTTGLIINAYTTLTTETNGWVPLARLHNRLNHIPTTTINNALTELLRDQWIDLIAETNQKTLTAEDNNTAYSLGGDPKHLYRVR